MWSYGGKNIWLNSNSDDQRVWGVLSKRNEIITNGFQHFHQAAKFIEAGQ